MIKRIWPHIALFGANLIYAGNYSIAKTVMPGFIKPFGFILLRVIGAILFFWTTSLFFGHQPIKKQDWGRLFLCGIFGVSINQLTFFKGLSLTTPINASIMMIMTPVLVLFISLLSKSEAFSTKKLLGMFLGALGAFLIIGGSGFSFSGSNTWGDILVLINAISYAIYLVLVKRLMKSYHPITMMKWIYLFGFPLVFLFGKNEFSVISWDTFSLCTWSAVFYVVFIVSCLAYVLNISAIQVVNPSLVGIYVYLQPVLTAIIALIWGTDRLTMIQVLAAMLIFGGIYFVNNKTIESKTQVR